MPKLFKLPLIPGGPIVMWRTSAYSPDIVPVNIRARSNRYVTRWDGRTERLASLGHRWHDTFDAARQLRLREVEKRLDMFRGMVKKLEGWRDKLTTATEPTKTLAP